MSVDHPNGTGDPPEGPPTDKPSMARRWRYFSRRHAILAGLIIGVGAFALVLLVLFLYRFGYIDRYVAGQIKNTFANYGIRAEIKEFHSPFPPQTVEMSGVELFDAQTGGKLGKIDQRHSTITDDGRAINNIDVQARGRVNQTRAEIEELVVKSPVVEARLQGTMDDWRALHYQMNVTSSVDLTQLSDTLQTSATLRGVGNFSGTVSGEGDHFKVQGAIKSDALAADGMRLQGLNVTASGSGQGKSYEINGKAVADLLSTG